MTPPLPQTDEKLPKGAWLVVALLFFAGLLDYLDRLMPITMRLSIKEAIPMTDAQFGLLTTVFFLTYATLVPFIGFAADRWGCSRIITISLLAWSGLTWYTAHATTFRELLITRALMGAAEASYLPAAGALIGKYHRNATLSLATGIHLSGVTAGSILSGLGGSLAETHGWRFPFVFFGLFGMGFGLVLLVLLRDPKTAEANPAAPEPTGTSEGLLRTFLHLFRRRKFVLAMGLYMLMGMTNWVFMGWMPAFLGESFHLSQGKSGLVATGFAHAGGLLGYLVGGLWSDRWSRSRVSARTTVAVIGLLAGVPCVVLVAHTNVLAFAAAGLLVFGLVRAAPDANMIPILFQFVDRRHRGTALGFLYAFGSTTGGILIYVGGAVRDAHINIASMFYAGIVGTLISAAMLWAIRPKEA